MEQILINLVTGALGGMATGKSSPTFDLGTVGNIIFGLVGGGVLGQIVTLALPETKQADAAKAANEAKLELEPVSVYISRATQKLYACGATRISGRQTGARCSMRPLKLRSRSAIPTSRSARMCSRRWRATARALRRVVEVVANARAQLHCRSSFWRI
jgi:uncharacterized membrane protein YeaQ/YmgE (transglycosylase-associated protein family)